MADENNIGASRLLGTNGLQQAVDSLTTNIGRLTSDVGRLSTGFGNMTGAANRAAGSSGSTMGILWNSGSNRSSYSTNGGGGNFSGGSFGGMSPNGGNGAFGPLGRNSRLSAGLGATAAVLSGLTGYANKNMSTNMQMDFYGTQSAIAGGFTGGFRGPAETARALAFNNNYAALNATDAARAAYVNQYTFGNSQFNGQANPAFVSGMRQANAFAYASPTLGATGGATAAQQTFSARATMVAPALGLASPILAGGKKNTMSNIAQSIYSRTFGNQRINPQQLDASLSQGGSLNVNLQYFGQAMGWNQNTIQEYQNIIRGQVVSQNKGISSSRYYNLLEKAGTGDKSAINQLAKTTGMGSSMFENQRNLNATRLTRQNDILNSLAPAFDSATKAVNKFSNALTAFLKTTHLDQAIGTGAGWAAPFSNALSGFGNAFGAGVGLFGAARLFRGGGSLLSGLGGLFSGGGGGAARTGATNGLLSATQGANGVWSVPGTGATGISGAATTGLAGLGVTAAAGAAYLGLHADDKVTANMSQFDIYRKAAGKALTSPMNVLNPFGQIATGAKWGKKGLNKLTSIFGGSSNSATGGGSGGSIRATGTNSGANAAQVISFAEKELGDPYVWGGTGPNGWDCSGLIQWAYGKAGVKLPRTAADQQKQGKPVPTDQVQPGDLLFNGNPAHHVVMAIGGGKVIEAPHTGANVRIRSFKPGEFTNARRILGSVGNMNSLLNENSSNTDTLNNQQSKSGGDIGSYKGTSELEALMSSLSGATGGGSVGLTAASSGAANTSGNPNPTGNVKGTGSNKVSSLQAYAKKLLAQRGWAGQWGAFNSLEMSEAGWNPKATNPSSGAYGLAQALPPGKYASAGSDWKTNGETQLRWMMDYIDNRYHSPNAAWSFHQRNNWYAAGAWNIDKDQKATVHQGEMIIPAQQAETIRQTLLNNTFNPNLKGSSGTTVQFGDINVNLPSGYSGSSIDAKLTGKLIVDSMNEQLRIKNLQIGQ